VFHQLSRADIAEIAQNMLQTVTARMQDIGLGLIVADSAIELVAEQGFDPIYGARPLRRAIQRMVEDKAAELLLEGVIKAGDTVEVAGEDGEIVLSSKVLVEAMV